MTDFEIVDKDYINKTNKAQYIPSTNKGMLGFLLRKGIVKSEKSGNYLLISIAIFFFVMSFLMF